MSTLLTGFDAVDLANGRELPNVHAIGVGPPVLLLHEIPGISPPVVRLARSISDSGFRVYLPHLFGTIGPEYRRATLPIEIVKLCINREFAIFAANRSSPIVNLLRTIVAVISEHHDRQRVGVIGLCVTGNFALSLIAGTGGQVAASVVAQPTLPLALPLGSASRCALHLSLEERAEIAQAATPVLGLRFSEDRVSPRERFDAIEQLLGARFERHDIDSRRGNPAGISPGSHAVLTVDFNDSSTHPTRVALDRTIAFLREHLGMS